MTDHDLNTKLQELTDPRPEPIDPAAPVRLRITRRQRRRQGAAVLASAAAAASVFAAVPVLDDLRTTSSEAAVAGTPTGATPSAGPAAAPPSTGPIGATPSAGPTGATPSAGLTGGTPSGPTGGTPSAGPGGTTRRTDHTKVLAGPWSASAVTQLPDANPYLPNKAYYVARGTVATESWAVLAFSAQGCLVSEEGAANSFGRPSQCFGHWPAGQRSAFTLAQGRTEEKRSQKLDSTLVMGAVSVDARTVRVTVAGQRYTAQAVATPASDRLRFFALVVPKKDLGRGSVTVIPLEAGGNLADAPTGVPPARS